MVNGIKQKPIEGVSMLYTFDKANANAPSKRTTQYFEMAANRGIYRDGWYACTTPPVAALDVETRPMPKVDEYKWELYNMAQDFSQSNDLAAKMPDKLRELQASFSRRRKSTTCFRWTTPNLPARITPRPSAIAGQTEFTYSGEMPGIPPGNAPRPVDQVLHDHRRRRRPARRRRRDDRDVGRPVRRLRIVRAQGEAGLHVQFPGSAAVPLGSLRSCSRRASIPWCSISPTRVPASPRGAPAC